MDIPFPNQLDFEEAVDFNGPGDAEKGDEVAKKNTVTVAGCATSRS